MAVSIKARSSLAYRTGLSILLGATLLTAGFSYFFYDKTYQEQLRSAERQLQQLFTTVESSAAVAAYLDNSEIASEVASGLTSNEIVSGVKLTSLTGMNISSGSEVHGNEAQLKTFQLASPFMSDDIVGEVLMLPNDTMIKQNAQEAAWRHVILMSAHSFVLVVLAIVLVHRNLSYPLKQLAKKLHQIPPGSKLRLDCPKNHKNDEIGLLIHDANTLLTATQNTLEGEIRLREYAESLEKQFRLIFESASCGIALVDIKGKVLKHNPSFESIIIGEGSVTLSQLALFDHFTNPDQIRSLVKKALQADTPVNCDLQLRTAPKQPARWLNCLLSRVVDDDNYIVEFILYDISERTLREKKNQIEAERDPLTQLYNRRAGIRQIETIMKRANGSAKYCAFLLLDLDKFKPINDKYGHEAGDRVLKTVATRLNICLRRDDVLVRWGGDEFLVVVELPNKVDLIAQKILSKMQEPIEIEKNLKVSIGASIGIAYYTENGVTVEDLIHNADLAMYQIKQSGRNNFAFYDDYPEQKKEA